MSTSPIPPVLDQDRYAVYRPTAATTDFALGFPLFGEASDVAVYLDGNRLALTSEYTVRSVSNGASLTPAPVSDAYVRLNAPISAGTLEIFGNFRPRRTIQASAPYGTRDFNFAFSLLMAALREMWSKFTRAIKVPAGEIELTIPSREDRAGQVLAFDSVGKPTIGGRYSDLMASVAAAAISAANALAAAQSATASASAAATFDPSFFLQKDDNLASLTNKMTARTNLGLAAVAVTGAYGDLSGRPTIGAGAGNLVALDASGKLPAVDGSQLTGLVFSKGWQSGEIALVQGGTFSVSHNLGVNPSVILGFLRCKGAEGGVGVGFEMPIPLHYQYNGGHDGLGLTYSNTTIVGCFASAGLPFTGINIFNGASYNYTPSKWSLILRAYA